MMRIPLRSVFSALSTLRSRRDPVVSENRIDTASLVPSVYQTYVKLLRGSAFEFSDTTAMGFLVGTLVSRFSP